MKFNHTIKVITFFLIIYCLLAFAGIRSSTALEAGNSLPTSRAPSLILSFDPVLDCKGSGEGSGPHPGWSSPSAIQLTLVEMTDVLSGLFWCPAAAPQGEGRISYTVTESTLAITCETEFTFCQLAGLSPASSFSIMATDKTGSYPVKPFATQNSGIISWCDTRPSKCRVVPEALTASLVGNLKSASKDCTFVAVANWESIALGVNIESQTLNHEFLQAGGGEAGLTNDQVFDYWNRLGVSGVYLNSVSLIDTDPSTLKGAMDSDEFKGLIAQLHFSSGQSFAGLVMSAAAFHWVVVAGYTEMGPVVVTWGQTLQMTWQQWNVEATTAWNFLTA